MMRIPDSLRLEHEQLHAKLAEATHLAGRTGEAARTVARIMHPHFLREDDYAIPPLGLLARLAKGQMAPDMAEVLPLVARLKEEMPLMIEEHRAIVGALVQLGNAASEEGRREWAEFADELRHHAQMEEEVLYPAAILVGEYVRHTLKPQASSGQE
ncbi:MAG TPA: hemerythrin domain-containing protein [Gemmatimonadales bacterium]|nr:hemerythrin domain-containing protein [Gemmatimonadales bacterium]